MKAIQAIWKDGQIIPSQPVDWPEGTTLNVEPVGDASNRAPGEIWGGDDPRAVAEFMALLPFQRTEEEEAEWQAARRDVKEYTIVKMENLSIEDRE